MYPDENLFYYGPDPDIVWLVKCKKYFKICRDTDSSIQSEDDKNNVCNMNPLSFNFCPGKTYYFDLSDPNVALVLPWEDPWFPCLQMESMDTFKFPYIPKSLFYEHFEVLKELKRDEAIEESWSEFIKSMQEIRDGLKKKPRRTFLGREI